MRNKNQNKLILFIKATVWNIIVALIFILILLGSIQIFAGEQLTRAMTLFNLVSVSEDKNVEPVKVFVEDDERVHFEVYPAYGERYGRLKIESIDVDLALCNGEDLATLRKGVGQAYGSYFPGQGGSIICMAHDTSGFLKYLYTVNIGDKIEIQTDYGRFTYEIYETKIVHQSETNAVYAQREEEILMLYTCYPSNSIGHATHRFITYSKLIDKEIYR